MQKNVTRIIAVLLAVILAVVAFVVPVFAEDCCNEEEDNGGYVMPENPDHRDIDGEFVSERGSIIIGHHGESGTPGEYYFHKYGALIEICINYVYYVFHVFLIQIHCQPFNNE